LSKWCVVVLRREVKEKLMELRSEMGVRSINDVVSNLVEFYEKSRAEAVRITVCNDLGSAAASYQGWVRILAARGLTPTEIAEALNYLTGTLEDLRVDKKKCEEKRRPASREVRE